MTRPRCRCPGGDPGQSRFITAMPRRSRHYSAEERPLEICRRAGTAMPSAPRTDRWRSSSLSIPRRMIDFLLCEWGQAVKVRRPEAICSRPASLAGQALAASNADWKIVIGHHPVYSGKLAQETRPDDPTKSPAWRGLSGTDGHARSDPAAPSRAALSQRP